MQPNDNEYDELLVPERIVSPEMAECYLELAAVIDKMRRRGIKLVVQQEFDFDDDDMPFRQTQLALECGGAGRFASVVVHTEQLFEDEEENLFLEFDASFESECQTLAVKLLRSFPYTQWKDDPLDLSFNELMGNPLMPHGAEVQRFAKGYLEVLRQARREYAAKSSGNSGTPKK